MKPSEPPDLCAERIDELLHEDALPGTPQLDRHRAHILARARAVPVVFHKRPGAPSSPTPRVSQMRRSLLKDEDPTDAILEVLRKTRGNYPERRAVFLSDRYLYADKPMLALRLSQVLRLDHLFSKQEKALVIERGTEIIHVTRREGRYWLPPIPDANPKKKHHHQLASLLLFDRVRLAEEAFDEPLHFDLRLVQDTLGFSTAKLERLTRQGAVVAFTTYGQASRGVVTWEGTSASLECETRGQTAAQALETARENWRLDQELIDPVLAAAHEMIFRRLPFDEPKTEEGQQDGLLRLHFRQAYRHYGYSYEFNGDNYYVFDGYGRPRLPQVCIDFITDSYDWGTGGRWPERGQKRQYVRGALNFASLGMENARSVENFAEFTSELPEWFDVKFVPRSERIKFRHRKRFFDKLLEDQALYRRGDIVFIYGLKDDGKFHYHSFMIDEKDPVTGMPTVLVANAGPAQARTWEGEMQNAPRRSIVQRVRVRREVLRRAHEQAEKNPGVPLESPRPIDEDDEREERQMRKANGSQSIKKKPPSKPEKLRRDERHAEPVPAEKPSVVVSRPQLEEKTENADPALVVDSAPSELR